MLWEQDVVSSNLAVPTILKKPPRRGGFFIRPARSVELFRSAERSTAKFCETQNIPLIREAHLAETERSVVNLAVPTILKKPPRRGGFFIRPARSVELSRAARRSNAGFCEPQNLHVIRRSRT
jgi:hypothetical protein